MCFLGRLICHQQVLKSDVGVISTKIKASLRAISKPSFLRGRERVWKAKLGLWMRLN